MTRNGEVTSPSCDGAVNPRRVQELLSGFVMQPADYTDLETGNVTEMRKEGGKKKTPPRAAAVECVLSIRHVCSHHGSHTWTPRKQVTGGIMQEGFMPGED